jgi:hypothetical protein
MPLFYDTSSPTPNTKNTINRVAVEFGIRDFLLNLNLEPKYPQISTAINGSPQIGQPVLDTSINGNANVIPIGLPLEINGILWKDLNVIYNTFQNDSSLANDLESIEFIASIPNSDFGNAQWPTNSQYPTGANSQVTQYGIKGKTENAQYRKNNVIKNLYLDSTSQIDMADFIGLNPLDISQQLGNYTDSFGGLNQNGVRENRTANIIGSLLGGQGVGIGRGGSVIPNFDLRASLAGRVLGGTGFIKDTKLGNIGAQQLALALANNAAFNVQQDILGALNIKENIFSLIKDGKLSEFPRPNYRITVPKSTGGQILNGITRVLGFQIPRSYLDESGSIFQSENGDVANIDRANAMILNTGKGQVKSLISNVIENSSVNSTNNPFRSGYVPAYKNNKGDDAVPSASTKVYAYSTNGNVEKLLGNSGEIIPSISYLREEMTSDSGFNSPEELGVTTAGLFGNTYDNRKPNNIGFSWTSQNSEALNKVPNLSQLSLPGFLPNVLPTDITGDKKSLLVKTQKLFNSAGMKTLVSVKGEMGVNSSQIQTTNENGLSKGSAVLKKERFNLSAGTVNSSGSNAENHFCRSWTTLNRYDSIQKLIRNKPLYDDKVAPYRNQTNGSVLDGPFVKIAPYSNEVVDDIKKYMFSIENLAWSDRIKELPPCERGNGDLTTGQKGRIMWFPPYDISINENSTVNWEETNFIGRGEPVYSYNNTKRSGQLSFKVIVDHPSYFNAFSAKKNSSSNGPDDNFIASFFAGCVDMQESWSKKLTTTQRDVLDKKTTIIPQEKNEPENPNPLSELSVYFPNDVKIYNPAYEDGKCSGGADVDRIANPNGEGCGLGLIEADVTQKDINGKTKSWEDRYDYGLNVDFNDPNKINEVIDFLKTYPWSIVKVKGYASPQGVVASNQKLANERAELLRDKLKQDWGSQLGISDDLLTKRFRTVGSEVLTSVTGCLPKSKDNPNPPTDTEGCKNARKATISFDFDVNLKAEFEKTLQPDEVVEPVTEFNVRKEIVNKFYTECDYFEKLTEKDKFIFDSIREKIRYFHPAFHSTTPEGLNSRLTFLLQCTRQGPTLEKQGPNNLAFGRPPVCILRIGDFYHTKIVIDNVNITYDPLVWDLNPEGVGVQPMIANVDMSFSFIGGSSLLGPINKLQNALSFNYFANTQVYDPRADYISRGKDKVEITFEDDNSGDGGSNLDGVVGIAKKLPTYNIIDGKPWEDPIEIEIERNIKESSSVETDQISNEENTNGGENNIEQDISSEENDIKVVSRIGILSYLKIEENEDEDMDIDFIFSFQIDSSTQISLTKKYIGKFYILNRSTNEKQLIDTISLAPNSQNSIIYSNTSNSTEVIIDKLKINFGVQVSIDNNPNLVSFIKNAYTTPNSSLLIEWETGSKVNYGWSKSIAKDSFNQ